MYIDDRDYQTNDMNNVMRIRCALFNAFYSNEVMINTLQDTITQYIECLSIDYDNTKYAFTLKIKKTAMRRMHNRFIHQPSFYYPIISNIFLNFISNYRLLLANTIKNDGKSKDPAEAYDIVNELIANPSSLSLLAHVSCISDNIVIINL